MTNVSQLTTFAPEQVIRKLVKDNPKQPTGKSYARFALYEDGLTVAQYVQRSVDAGNKESVAYADLRWDVAHRFIEVGTVAATEPAPKAKPAKTKTPVAATKSAPKTKVAATRQRSNVKTKKVA